MLSSLSLFFFAFIALICLFPATPVKAEEAHPEYGTVIGIGKYSMSP
jgi:heat shock protein 5